MCAGHGESVEGAGKMPKLMPMSGGVSVMHLLKSVLEVLDCLVCTQENV